MIPSKWFSHDDQKHPFQKMAWYLQDHSEQIPTEVLDDIVSNLQEIESNLELQK